MKLGITLSTFKTQFGPIIYRGGDLKNNIYKKKKFGYQGIDLFKKKKSNNEIISLSKLFKEENIEVGRKKQEISIDAIKALIEKTNPKTGKQYSYRDIAKELNTSPPTIMRRLKE